jgi:tRNA A37 threonylcarbamoyladenosine dehydratase
MAVLTPSQPEIKPTPFILFSPFEAVPADLERRFGGLSRLYGAEGARRIRAAHAVVVGIGGVGSWAAEALARSGVARLTLIDLDHVAESNINRQVHALEPTLGKSKVQAMRDRIRDINSHCIVNCIEDFVDAANWPQIAALDVASPDTPLAVIDACDQVRAKTAMADWAMANGILFISAGAAGGKRHAHRVDIEDLSLVTHDPLLAQLRYRLRKERGAARQGKIGVACVFSREPMTQPEAACAPGDGDLNRESDIKPNDGTLNCHGYGSVVSVTSTFGACAAGWLLDKIACASQNTPKRTL